MGNGLTVCFVALALSAIGCAAPAIGNDDVHHVARDSTPEALTLDVFKGDSLTATCSATLLTRKVALTSSRCLTGGDSANVRAPNAKDKESDIVEVHLYDETSDIALLVLGTSIKIAKYPRISGEDFEDETVRQIYRTDDGVATGKLVKIDADEAGPSTMYVPHAKQDVGGTYFYKTETGTHVITGVTAGTGDKSHGAYVAKLTDPDVRAWIKSVAANAASTTTGVTTKTLHVLDTDDEDAGDDSEVEVHVGVVAKRPKTSSGSVASQQQKSLDQQNAMLAARQKNQEYLETMEMISNTSKRRHDTMFDTISSMK